MTEHCYHKVRRYEPAVLINEHHAVCVSIIDYTDIRLCLSHELLQGLYIRRNKRIRGKGVSQGHSDAIRRLDGVKDARQYTIPVEDALNAVRAGEAPQLSTRQKHLRECFVVAEEGADLAKIEQEIVTMPNYFADYDTTVHFISEEELMANHSGIPHGGFVIHSGKTGVNNENTHVIEYGLKLDSNPEFTASVLVAYARAAYGMHKDGITGCKTVFDVAPRYLSPMSDEQLRKEML